MTEKEIKILRQQAREYTDSIKIEIGPDGIKRFEINNKNMIYEFMYEALRDFAKAIGVDLDVR